MKEKKKQSYLSPELTVVQFRVERGYATSEPVNLSIYELDLFSTEGGRAVESRSNGGYWGNEGEETWF